MTKAIVLNNYNDSWAIENRVEALSDWYRNSPVCPFDIDSEGDSCTIIFNNEKRAAYENDYSYQNDLKLALSYISDIKDPLNAADTQFKYKEIDLENANPNDKKSFSEFAFEHCSPLACDMLRAYGLTDIAEKPYETHDPTVVSEQVSNNRMREIEKMLAGMESGSDVEGPDEDIPVIDTSDMPVDPIDNDDSSSMGDLVGDAEPEEVVESVEEVVAEKNEPEETNEVPDTTVNDAISAVTNIDKPVEEPKVSEHESFLSELASTCKEFDITAKEFVTMVVALKKLANKTAVVKGETIEIDTDDVTGNEDYSYTNAVPYVQNPHEQAEPEIETQAMNVPEGENNSEIGNESISADSIYESLVNESHGTLFDVTDNDVNDFEWESSIIETNLGMEAFLSKRKGNKYQDENQVVADMKKICEDVKVVAKKAFNELMDRNAEVFEKYGAFIKLLNDIIDAVFMSKHVVKLEIAKFDIQKANREIVPDNLEESIFKQLGSTVLRGALGPFAALANSDEKPGTILLTIANRLRQTILTRISSEIKKYPKATINLVEDEIKGSYTLTLMFDPIQSSLESVEEEPKYKNLMEQLAFESSSDDEFFGKVLENKDQFSESQILDCAKFNMRDFYRTGTKTQTSSVLAAIRRNRIYSM